MSQSKMPQMRFKGFSGEWDEKELSSICSMNARIGWQNLRTSEFLDSGDYYLITGTDFENGRVNFKTCHYVEKYRYTQDKKIQVTNGNILITKDGTLGKVAYVEGMDKPATLNAGVFNVRTKSKNIDKKYIFQYLKAPFLMNYVDEKATGGTIKHLNQNILVDFPVKIPNIDEQTKIGNYFQKLDKLIEQKQIKQQKLKQLKKAMLDKMFPKDGADTPEIRFKGFSGEWVEKELGEVVEIIMGQSPSSKSYNSDKKGIPLIQGNADIHNRLSCPRNWTTEKTKECKVGDLILTVRAPVGAIAKSIHNACIGRGVCAIKHTIKSADEFIYQFLVDYEEKWSILEQGSTFTAVSGTEIRKIKIKIPKIIEQTKIGNYFQKLDKQIDLQLQELEKLKNIKKASLDKMFV